LTTSANCRLQKETAALLRLGISARSGDQSSKRKSARAPMSLT
jgi:hypothetical protein